MNNKTSIKKETIIEFNNQYVYWKNGTGVWQGKRRTNRDAGNCTLETNRDLTVATNSMRKIKHIFSGSSQKTIEVLKRYGIKTIHARKKT